jgi:hypothetical protein
MTLQTFFQWLRKRAKRYGFKLTEETRIREKRTRHCSITAVCHEKTGAQFHPEEYGKAAWKIGLKADDMFAIVNAADYVYPKLRRRVLKATGLAA